MKLAKPFLCTGCSACASVCRKRAVLMVPDIFGFMHPKIDTVKCVNCGACERVCPALHPREVDCEPICFAAKCNDEHVRMKSTSGGVFPALARRILASGGIVYGCRMTEGTCKVEHARIEHISELQSLQGSKYLQSDIGDTFIEAAKDVRANRKVLFTGTPCQIAGLLRCITGKPANLLTMEILCHGAPSSKMFEALKKDLSRKYRGNGGLVSVSFRQKEPRWGSYAIRSEFSNGASFVEETPFDNWYNFAFISRASVRSSCFFCSANNGRSGADITTGDYWGVEKYHPEMDDGRGVSAVIVHSRNGLKALKESGLELKGTKLEWITNQGKAYNSPRRLCRFNKAYLLLANTLGPRRTWGSMIKISRTLKALGRFIGGR